MKFRNKPVVIEAFQLTQELAIKTLIDNEPLPFGLSINHANYHQERREVYQFCILIDTLEGKMKAEKDDWIIKGVKGELYPCKPDIFAILYDAVVE